ncbi:hypothetical protein SNE40_015996 [Patella caerulea]|uniref:PUB domain-containing protein n=1 Tax=Patella caerulea TaxID=87958 RepID=A0AAN8JCY6_PATCE
MASPNIVPDTESIGACLLLLQSECPSQTDFKAAIDMVIKICRNIQANPQEEKYKNIKKDSKSLSKKIWQFSGGQELMLAIGWVEVDENIMYIEEKDLPSIIKLLEDKLKENGFDSTSVQSSTNVQVSNGWTTEEMRKKEKLLEIEKEKRLASIKRKREEEKRVKAQIEADRSNINVRELKASKAVEKKGGSNIKRFADIGVDVNGQEGG